MRPTRYVLLAALALAVLAGAPAAVAGKPVGFAESFPTKCNVETVSATADGGTWFACTRFSPGRRYTLRSRAVVGQVTAAGKVTEFPPTTPTESGPGDVSVTAADGSFWVPVEKSFYALTNYVKKEVPTTLARVTPTGQMTLFPVTGGAVLELAATPDGFVWMKTAEGFEHKGAIVWQVAPDGTMTKTAADPALPLGEVASFPQKPITTPGTILAGSVIGADGNLWYGVQSGGIGRVTPTGESTLFNDCLAYSQPYFGPETLVRGVEGNIWFTSLAERSLPNIVDPASIGMITPAGAITQFYAGVKVEPKTISADPEGGAWFAGRGGEVQRIRPPAGPVNTFHVGKLFDVRANGSGRLIVKVPGSGRIHAKPLAIIIGEHPKTQKRIRFNAATGTASTGVCGSPEVKLKLAGEALRRLQADREVSVAVAVTFTPQGGTPYTEEKTLYFHLPHRR